MEIQPASIDDVKVGRDGRRYLVSAEAGTIAARLKEVDPRVYVEFHEPPAGSKANPYYSVCLHRDNAHDDLIFRVREQDFDQRVVEHLRMLNFNLRHGISEADRWEAEEDARRREANYQFEQQMAANAGRLMHSIQRTILGTKPRISLHQPKPKGA